MSGVVSPEQVRDELLGLIADRISNHPRSLQVEVGPSEIGTPCARKLGYKLAGVPARPQAPNWRATVGTAVHAWLEKMLADDNEAYYTATEPRWLLEHRVWAGDVGPDALDGNCDVYDRHTATVIDWKIPGPASMKTYRKAKHPGDTYRTQAHLYGRGWRNIGLPVETVMIVCLPSAGELSEAWCWHEPYDEQVALDALTRATAVRTALDLLGPDVALPQLGTADDHCRTCEWRLPTATNLAVACPGDASLATPPTPALTFTAA